MQKSGGGQETRFHAVAIQEPHRLNVERDEGFPAQPLSVMGDDSVREIAAHFQHGEAKNPNRLAQ